MPLEVKLWTIENNRLMQCETSKLDLERRLEDWLEDDISLISDRLLVIGRQVDTAYSGPIDLLCIDDEGDLAIVELKKDRTPRDVTAQALEYASWVRDLPSEEITKIANDYFKGRSNLEDAFENRFGDVLPDMINNSHKIFIVASSVDPSTERIIKYLSDEYGVSINVVTFNFFKIKNMEFISRVFLIDPNQVDDSTIKKRTSKRRPNLTFGQIEELMRQKGTEDLFKHLVENLSEYFYKHTTRSSLAFEVSGDTGRTTVFSILPNDTDKDKGLCFQVKAQKLEQATGKNIEELKNWFTIASNFTQDTYSDGKPRFNGFFKTKEQIDSFVSRLKDVQWK